MFTWVLEPHVFSTGDAFRAAAEAAGHRVVTWSDRWWLEGGWPALEGPVVFRGSLGNADRLAREARWRPGAFCATERLRCSAWYPRAGAWLLNERWEIHPAHAFVEQADRILDRLEAGDAVFVRPDSPLKPFSGRVLSRANISLRALDHGFYFDEVDLPVVVAPERPVAREWRFVVVERQVVAGSAYESSRRGIGAVAASDAAWQFAAEVASAIDPPEVVYVLDVCESLGRLRLLELNPFSGADLYACDPAAVVRAVGEAIESGQG